MINKRELVKFSDPDIVQQYMDKYGDPLEDVTPQDLMDLMENLWTSNRGSYAQMREAARRQGQDPWTVRLALVHAYFKSLFIRQEKLDETAQADKVKIDDASTFISYRIDALIKAHQEQEAEEARYSRDKFGHRAPRI